MVMNKSGRVTFSRHFKLPGIEICRVEQSLHAFPNHAHEELYAIGLMERGSSYCVGHRKGDALMTAGQIALINPGQIHSGVPADGRPISYRMLYIELAAMRAFIEDLRARGDLLPEFERLLVADGRLGRLLWRMFTRMERSDDRLANETFLLEALAPLLSGHTGLRLRDGHAVDHHRAVRMAKEMMVADLEQKLTLNDLAVEVGMSRHHFLRVFKKATGLPPHMFRTLKRVDEAKRRLLQGRPPVQVAFELGFTDQSHFIKTFKQFTGATPGQYQGA